MVKLRQSYRDFVRSKSLMNCHVAGLDSFLLDDKPGGIVRAFSTQPHHTLWQGNGMGLVGPQGLMDPMSLAVHAHHCSVVLHAIHGDVFNIVETGKAAVSLLVRNHKKVAAKGKFDRVMTYLEAYSYQSAITHGPGRFTPVLNSGHSSTFDMVAEWLSPDQLRYMPAADRHTVFVPQGTQAAWYVLEGDEDPQYKPIAYSNANLAVLDFSQLYQPMDQEYFDYHFDVLLERLEHPVLPQCIEENL